eukprot:GHRQ01038668.1.p2 GENE.GHRQ01038668.1~~GHRQ01038668.1.p2  ORF type:complete len:122 (-),score=49.88 GHRQ01038668.1:75-440(-)
MAVVDASVGIKTAVNFGDKKNKLGTYCPPLGVLCDTAFLKTLDSRHISNGAAEMLKMACIKDAPLFELLEEHAEGLIASKFQVRCCCGVDKKDGVPRCRHASEGSTADAWTALNNDQLMLA